MLHVEASKTQFSDHADTLTIQTLAGYFTIKELVKGDQPGQLVITSDLPLTVARDGNSIIVGTAQRRREIDGDDASECPEGRWAAQNWIVKGAVD